MNNQQELPHVRFFAGSLHTISIYEIVGERCMFETDGENICVLIKKGLHKPEDKVCVDFQKVRGCTHQFLRGAFGGLIMDMSRHEINTRIAIKDIYPHHKNLLNIVMHHCAKWASEKKHNISLNR